MSPSALPPYDDTGCLPSVSVSSVAFPVPPPLFRTCSVWTVTGLPALEGLRLSVGLGQQMRGEKKGPPPWPASGSTWLLSCIPCSYWGGPFPISPLPASPQPRGVSAAHTAVNGPSLNSPLFHPFEGAIGFLPGSSWHRYLWAAKTLSQITIVLPLPCAHIELSFICSSPLWQSPITNEIHFLRMRL